MLEYLSELVFCLLSLASVWMVGRKWEMSIRQYGVWSIIATLLGLGVVLACKNWLPALPWIIYTGVGLGFVCAISAGIIAYFFFRDPERVSPTDENLLISPADGRIVYIKKISNGEFPFALKKGNTIPLENFSKINLIPTEGWQIGIAMNFLDVHVNRSPIKGKVTMVERIPGEFKSLKHIKSLLENERMLLVLEGEKIRVGMVQIASRLVRRIVPYVKPEEMVETGKRVGMIRFGSQVDLLIPTVDGLELLVNEKDEVIAGESILGRFDFDKIEKTKG